MASRRPPAWQWVLHPWPGGAAAQPAHGTGVLTASPAELALSAKRTKQLDKIDELVLDAMHKQGVHAAQIAVAKDSKLKFVRSYTFAERNWPVTNAHHRMRMGSIAKLLMGMRACVEGQDFLHTPISDLLPPLQLHMGYFAILDRLEKYGATRMIDLLRYQSGWKVQKTLYKRVLETVQRLPLQAADFTLYTTDSDVDFVSQPPATEEDYNNANFVAASEILNHRSRSSYRLTLAA